MIPRFVHEQLINNCDILVEMFKRYEKIKAQNNMELKKGDKIVCNNDNIEGFTNGEEYEINNLEGNMIEVISSHELRKRFLKTGFNRYFKLKEETETAYKETEGKLHYELDFEFITQMAERMASNKKEGKYSMYNWMKPMSKTDLINLIQAQYRHAMDLMNFKFDDDGRPYGTLEAFSNNAMMINYQLKTYFKDYKFSKQDLLEMNNNINKKENDLDIKNGDSFFFKDNKSDNYIFMFKTNEEFNGFKRDVAYYRNENEQHVVLIKPYKDFIKEIQVSPSSKINTTDSTGLLTEEK